MQETITHLIRSTENSKRNFSFSFESREFEHAQFVYCIYKGCNCFDAIPNNENVPSIFSGRF